MLDITESNPYTVSIKVQEREMETKVIGKPNMQNILKEFKDSPLVMIETTDEGYAVRANQDGKTIKKGDVLLKAYRNKHNYIVGHVEGLLIK